MADDLRARLLGQAFAPDDDALLVHVDTALAVVTNWLRAEADRLRALRIADAARAAPSAGYRQTLQDQIWILNDLARSLTQPSTEEKRA